VAKRLNQSTSDVIERPLRLHYASSIRASHGLRLLENLPMSTELEERKKELRFLHHATRLLNMPGEPRDILRAVLELLPSAMRLPELAGARLSLGPLEIFTLGYERTEHCLHADFSVEGDGIGRIEVCYLQAPPFSPAFVEEEQALIESFAELARGYFELGRARKAHQRLLQSESEKQEATSKTRAQDQFLSTVSHELRSSLHVMLGWVQVLRQGTQDPSLTARGLQILERNVTLQAKLVEDLLDLSRMVSGKLRIDPGPLDLAELVGFAVDATRPSAEAKQLKLSSRLERVGQVLGDQQRLQQVVYNLLGNAIKFTPAGGQIHVELSAEGASARLTVTDTGIGIDSELLPHIFERFRQADAARPSRHSGLGLGLAIARHLVELHQGKIAVRSNRPESGTTFEITLPRLPAAASS
jgi:signal transduction histidine kinase